MSILDNMGGITPKYWNRISPANVWGFFLSIGHYKPIEALKGIR
jgi:hypothetical protein